MLFAESDLFGSNNTGTIMDINSTEYKETKARIKRKLDVAIEEDMLSSLNERRRNEFKHPLLMTLAACISLTAAVVLLFSAKGDTDPKEDSVKWEYAVARYGEKKSVMLPDGTEIWLHNDSWIMYPDRFTGKVRQIFSSGEVFAKVTKDKRHPFILSCDNVNISVKGTTFNYRSYPDNPEVELTLIEGAVDMKMVLAGEKKSMSVYPGQIIKANLEDGIISQLTTDPFSYISWKDTRAIYFNDETLENIVSELQRQFEIKITVMNKALLKTRYYASFVNGESPMQIFNSLNTIGIMKIKKDGNTYYIY